MYMYIYVYIYVYMYIYIGIYVYMYACPDFPPERLTVGLLTTPLNLVFR